MRFRAWRSVPGCTCGKPADPRQSTCRTASPQPADFCRDPNEPPAGDHSDCPESRPSGSSCKREPCGNLPWRWCLLWTPPSLRDWRHLLGLQQEERKERSCIIIIDGCSWKWKHSSIYWIWNLTKVREEMASLLPLAQRRQVQGNRPRGSCKAFMGP